ncbi:MAG: [acyl-carrier-protein] S-malonyltransferase [Myxococcales bacterium]|nr:[acyl-carrier-protein] S-malonyltransferase [Myxococcales bacterium]
MIAFVFPGQGSQKVGMGRALAEALPSVRALYAAADDALGFKISALCFDGPEADLQLTANTQPAILTTSLAASFALKELAGIEPDVVAGHSLGEYSALVHAGAITFVDAVRLVHLRGKFMQEAVASGVGGMAAIIGLPSDAVADTCREASGSDGGECAPANFNGAGQVVIAGHAAAVERAMMLAKQKGAKLVKALPVSAPFHCALMQPAAERLAVELEKIAISAPRIPVVSNVEATENSDPARVKDLLYRQVTGSVRWEESVQRLAAMGVTRAIEVGPGKVLSGLCKRIAPSLKLASVEDPAQALALKESAHG